MSDRELGKVGVESKRILVVDDEALARDTLSRILIGAGHHVEEAFNADEAIAMLHRQPFDLVVLDVMMPHVDGFEACRRIREFSNVPVIFITGRSEVEAETTGLDLGADDYIQKPFHPRSVLSRIQAVLRRVREPAGRAGMHSVGPLALDLSARDAYVHGEPANLTAKEFELLHLLVSNAGKLISREELAAAVWGEDMDPESRTLDVHVYRLRKKLDELGDLGRFLKTKRQRGYLLSPLLRNEK